MHGALLQWWFSLRYTSSASQLTTAWLSAWPRLPTHGLGCTCSASLARLRAQGGLQVPAPAVHAYPLIVCWVVACCAPRWRQGVRFVLLDIEPSPRDMQVAAVRAPAHAHCLWLAALTGGGSLQGVVVSRC
jgi:hypothetical protein